MFQSPPCSLVQLFSYCLLQSSFHLLLQLSSCGCYNHLLMDYFTAILWWTATILRTVTTISCRLLQPSFHKVLISLSRTPDLVLTLFGEGFPNPPWRKWSFQLSSGSWAAPNHSASQNLLPLVLNYIDMPLPRRGRWGKMRGYLPQIAFLWDRAGMRQQSPSF